LKDTLLQTKNSVVLCCLRGHPSTAQEDKACLDFAGRVDAATTTLPPRPTGEDEEEEDEEEDEDGSLGEGDSLASPPVAAPGGRRASKAPADRASLTWVLTHLRKEISDTNRGEFRAAELLRYAEKGLPKRPMAAGGTVASVPIESPPLPYDRPAAALVKDAFTSKMAALRRWQVCAPHATCVYPPAPLPRCVLTCPLPCRTAC